MPMARLRIEREAIMSYDENEVWDNYYKNNPDKVLDIIHDEVVEGLDYCGAKIYKRAYGKDNPKHRVRWEVDHIKPESKGGSDELSNLRPLHWKNNKAKDDNEDGDWECAVEARQRPGGRFNFHIASNEEL